MSKLEMISKVPDEEQHEADAEGVKIKGDTLFTCGDDGKVKVFDKNLKPVHQFQAHDYAVYDLIITGDTLFTCSIDSTIRTWDVNTFELKKTIQCHEESVRKFCSDGKLIYAGDEKGEVRGYTPDGELSVLYNVVEEVWSLYAKGNLLYSVRDRGVTITQVQGQDNKFCHCKSLYGRAPIYATDSLLVFPDTPGLCIDVRDNNRSSDFALKGQLKGTEMIITALGGFKDRILSGGWDSELRLWDISKMAEIGKATLPGTPNGIAATEDGNVYVVGIGGYICHLKAS